LETALHPVQGGEVELTGHVGVGAAARQRDQAALVVRRQAVGAVPDPVLALGAVERVQVEHGLPRRLRLAVLLERGAAPDAALVVLVAPEVVVPLALLVDARDLLVGVVDRQQLGLERLEGGVRGQLGLGAGVLLADPGQRALALHVLEPLVRIGRFGSLLCGRAETREGKRHGQAGVGQSGHAASLRRVRWPAKLAHAPTPGAGRRSWLSARAGGPGRWRGPARRWPAGRPATAAASRTWRWRRAPGAARPWPRRPGTSTP